jgi:Niemann-Pick C1 protein
MYLLRRHLRETDEELATLTPAFEGEPEFGSTVKASHNFLIVSGEKRDYDGAFRVGKTEALLRAIFTRWGRICGKYPLWVIFFSLVFSICLSVGIIKFNVTTNPVQLWSSPQSTSREQMDVFDNAFGPFYRTTQVIVTAPGVPGEVYAAWDNSAISITDIAFSGMFNQQLMIELLNFQNDIVSLTAVHNNKTVTLADICLRPLCNDTDTHRDPTCGIANCTIFSPLNWFQNSLSQFQKVRVSLCRP